MYTRVSNRVHGRQELLAGGLESFVAIRRGGRVVDCTGLENRNVRKGIEGSNPSLSASLRC